MLKGPSSACDNVRLNCLVCAQELKIDFTQHSRGCRRPRVMRAGGVGRLMEWLIDENILKFQSSYACA